MGPWVVDAVLVCSLRREGGIESEARARALELPARRVICVAMGKFGIVLLRSTRTRTLLRGRLARVEAPGALVQAGGVLADVIAEESLARRRGV